MIHVRNSGTKALAAVVLTLVLLAGCGPSMPVEYKWFFDLSPQQQHAEMKKFPLDKQVDYYLIGMTYVHPPKMGLATDIAQQGKTALPYLLKRLQDEKEDYRRANMMLILKEMSLFYYDLRNEQDALRVMNESIAQMKDPSWKQQAQDELKTIMERRVADPASELEKIRKDPQKPDSSPSPKL